MLRLRLVTGPLLIAALLLVVWLDARLETVVLPESLGGGPLPRGIPLGICGLAAAALAARELDLVFKAVGVRSQAAVVVLAAMTGFAALPLLTGAGEPITAIAAVASVPAAALVVALVLASRGRTVEGVVPAAGAALLACVYPGMLLGFLLLIRLEHSAWMVVGVLLVTKSCDIGAYFTGHAIGRHKLIPWLSPGKTREGLVGGVVASALVGMLAAWIGGRVLGPDASITIGAGAIAGAVFGLVGQLGDLGMSLMKRSAGIKDASRLLPGMGGLLDVLDSPLLVAPVAWWLLELVG